ncbi:MAG: hypothetical protein JOY54_06725 [Acidobacteriaceae bacterium]|nr:hypothetical protein [Acidobacteriaceae bacterium]
MLGFALAGRPGAMAGALFALLALAPILRRQIACFGCIVHPGLTNNRHPGFAE